MVSDPAIRDAITRAVARSRSGELTLAARAADADPARRTYQRAARRRVQQRHAELGGARETVIALLQARGIARADQHHPEQERHALAAVGFDRFPDYLTDRHAAGMTVAEMARELGHSTTWLRARARRDGLEALTRPRPDALARARQLAAASGFPRVEDYLRYRYEVDGLSARQLQRELGLHSQQVARLLDASGAERRHHRDVDERRVLAVVGYERLATYAQDRHARGFTVAAMAAELARSHPWLVRRLRAANLGHLIGPPGRATADPDTLARILSFDGLASYARQRTAGGATVRDMASELGHSDTWLARHLGAAGLGSLIGRPRNRYGRPARQDASTPGGSVNG